MAELKTTEALSAKALRFQAVLDQYAPGSKVVEFKVAARTAQQAADAIGCELDQIVKSLVFRSDDGRAVLVLTAGGNRVNETAVGEQLGAPVRMAEAAFVREHTGYAIGGVPPFGHPARIEAVVDEDLMRFDEVWAAGGHPNVVFPIKPDHLLAITGGRRSRVG